MSVSWEKWVRLLAVGIAVAVCAMVLNSYFGTADDVCAKGGCGHNCPHTACVSWCWADGFEPTNECTYAAYSPIAPIECGDGGGCRTKACQ